MSSFIFPGDSKVKVNDFSKPRPIYFTGDGVSVAEDVNNNRFTITISGGGDVVSASNVGTGEGDVFKQLNVDDLEFKTIKAGTNITVTNNADDITISAAGSVGEANTASNVGAGGVGVFKQKSTYDLELKNINAASSKITITDDTVNDEIDIDVDESALDLANIGGTLGDGSLSANVLTIDNTKTVTDKTFSGTSNIVQHIGSHLYEVYNDAGDSLWKARNTRTGAITSSNATFTTVLQAALDALGGTTVKETIKVKGSASVTTVISVPSYCIIDLTEAKLTLANSTATHMFINSDTVGGNTQIEIVGGIIDGNKTNQAAVPGDEDTRNIVQFTKVTDSSVRKMYIDEASARAIRFNDCTNCTAEYNTVIDTGAEGIQSKDGSDIKFLHNTVKSTGYSFITTYGTEDAIVAHNYCDDTVSTTTSGINISSVRNKVIGNTVRNPGGACIFLAESGSSYDASGVEVIGNILSGSGDSGGIMAAGYPLTTGIISDNIVFSNFDEGIRFSGAHNDIIINNNIVYLNGGSGIYVSGTVSTSNVATHIQITNNFSYNNGTAESVNDYDRAGINARGTDTNGVVDIIIKNNTCYDDQGTQTQKYGVRTENTQNSIVQFNNLKNNLTDGLISVTDSGLRAFENNGYASDTPVATTTGTETHTNKTYTSPTINSATLTGTVTLDSTSANYVQFVKPKTNSSAESLIKIRLDEDTGSFIAIDNVTGTNALFGPHIYGRNASSTALSGLVVTGQVHSSFDSGSKAALTLNASTHAGGALSFRPILDISSASTAEYTFSTTQFNVRNNDIINAGINLTNNTVTDTSRAQGDTIKDNGTKYVRYPMGTAHQISAVNAAGTDLAYTNPIPVAYDYIISKIGSTYYATKSGELIPKYSGSTLTTVCNNAASDLSTTGGVIAFAANSTFITSGGSIDLVDNVTWKGMDRITSIIKNSSAHQIFYWNDGGGAQLTNAGITDLHMIIHDPSTTEAAVYIDGSLNFKFNRNWVESKSTPSSGIIAAFFDTASLVHFHDNLEFKDNWLSGDNNGQDAFGSGNLVNAIVTGNTFSDHTDGQAIGAASPVGCIFANNIFQDVGNAIGFETVSKDNIISDNILYNTTGIKLAGFLSTDNESRNNRVTGNIIKYGSGGIEAGNSFYDVIENNTFYRTETNGIYGTFYGCRIIGNKFEDTNFGSNTTTLASNSVAYKDGGILMVNNSTPQPDSDYNLVEGNTFIDTGATFTDPVASGIESGDTGPIVIDTNYLDTILNDNRYIGIGTGPVFDFGSSTKYLDIDNHSEFDIIKQKKEVTSDFNFGDGTYGSGFFNAVTIIGSDNGTGSDADNIYRYYGTAATTGTQAGAVGNSARFKRYHYIRLFSRFKVLDTSNHAFFIGLTTVNDATETHATAPLNTIMGIGVAMTTDKSNFQIVHSDGSGACTFVDTNVPKDTEDRSVEIWTDDTNWYAKFSQGPTITITSNMPDQTTGMRMCFHNITSADEQNYLYMYRYIIATRTGA